MYEVYPHARKKFSNQLGTYKFGFLSLLLKKKLMKLKKNVMKKKFKLIWKTGIVFIYFDS